MFLQQGQLLGGVFVVFRTGDGDVAFRECGHRLAGCLCDGCCSQIRLFHSGQCRFCRRRCLCQQWLCGDGLCGSYLVHLSGRLGGGFDSFLRLGLTGRLCLRLAALGFCRCRLLHLCRHLWLTRRRILWRCHEHDDEGGHAGSCQPGPEPADARLLRLLAHALHQTGIEVGRHLWALHLVVSDGVAQVCVLLS